MFSNLVVFYFGLVIGLMAGVLGIFQSISVWKKQGFAVVRGTEEAKISRKYRKTSRSKIALGTQTFTYFLLFFFVVLMATSVITKIQVVILCFTFAASLIGSLGLVALIFDQHLRKK